MKYITNTKWKTETFQKIFDITQDEIQTSAIMNIIENEYLKLYGDILIAFNGNRTFFDSMNLQLEQRLGEIDVKKIK